MKILENIWDKMLGQEFINRLDDRSLMSNIASYMNQPNSFYGLNSYLGQLESLSHFSGSPLSFLYFVINSVASLFAPFIYCLRS